jgi:FAD dependent monooxygenase
MAPHAAMGANLAMESAACFVNEVRKFKGRHADSTQPGSLTTTEISQLLESYTNKRRGRVTQFMKQAAMTEKIHLKGGHEASEFLGALPLMTEMDWLRPALISLGQAEKLDDWKWNSDRVETYNKRAERIREALVQGQVNDYLSSVITELNLL